MPHEEDFDPAQWVKDLEQYLRDSVADLQWQRDHDPRLVAIARTQFELGCMALERALKGKP